jgi:hypothetical protein
MMMMGTSTTPMMMSQTLVNFSLLTTVVGLLAPGTVLGNISFGVQNVQGLAQHFMVSTHGCSGVLQDISRLYSMKTRVWGGRVSPLTIWCVGRPGRKHRECSLRPWYANSSVSFAVQCRASLMTTNLYSVSSTGADNKGLHQRGSTEPLRLCEHKARSKAADVRILVIKVSLA